MESQLAAVLTNGSTAVINRGQNLNSEGKEREMPPSAEIQEGALDLTQKCSSAAPGNLQSGCHEFTPSLVIELNNLPFTGEGVTDVAVSLAPAPQEVGVVVVNHQPIRDTVLNSTKATQDSDFTRCSLGHQRVSFWPGPKDRTSLKELTTTETELPTEEEIEKVCIGESPESVCHMDIEDKTVSEDKGSGAGTNGVTTTETNKGNVPIDTPLAPKMSKAVRAASCEQTIKGMDVMDANDNSSAENLHKVEWQRLLNSGRGSPNHSDISNASLTTQIKVEEKTEQEQSRQEGSANGVVPVSAIENSSQRWRELERKVKEEQVERRRLGKEREEECMDRSNPVSEPLNLYQEREEGSGYAKVEEGNSVEANMVQEEVTEVLDLSLPKKRERSDKERRYRWMTEETGYESSLLMEVDEIEEERDEEEMEEEEEDSLSPLRKEAQVGNLYMQLWDCHHSPSLHAALLSPSCSSLISPDCEDLLLIDDQGIPYTLTPDGHKVPQMDPPKHSGDLTEEPKRNLGEIKDEAVSLPDVPHPDQSLSHSHPNVLSGDVSPCPESSTETLKAISNSETEASHDSPVLAKPPVFPDLSSLPSQPIRIVANTLSNTPILLLPSSQLQTASSPAANSNPGLMAFSLPLTLAQNSPSSPMFLVLSSLPASSAQSPSSSTPLAIIDPSSGQLFQTPATSAVALPLTSGLLSLGSASTSNPSLVGLKPVSCVPLPNLSGKSKPFNPPPTLTSPSATSSTLAVTNTSPAKHLKTDVSSDTWMPNSFREALLRSSSPSDDQLVTPVENQTKSTEATSIPSSSSPKTSQPLSPKTTQNPSVHHSPNKVSTPTADPVSTSRDLSDPVPAEDEHLSTSTSPLTIEPIFPINHPKNLDNLSSTSSCPRRILYCRYCPRAFYYLSDLERHSITHSQTKPHVCQLCDKAFKRSSHLERHKHIHTGQRNFVCPICGKRFREAGELLRHQRVHTGEKPFQCPLCHMRFAERNTLRRHTKRKHQGHQQGELETDARHKGGGAPQAGVQGQQEECAEWYSSTVAEMESDNETDIE